MFVCLKTHGGDGWEVPSGRRDGKISLAKDTKDIPAPTDDLDKITAAFAKKGLSQLEMIALLGIILISYFFLLLFYIQLIIYMCV